MIVYRWGAAPIRGGPLLSFALYTALALVSALGIGCSSRPGPTPVQQISLLSEDGFTLTATLYTPEDRQNPPGIILVHRYGGSPVVWEGFANHARQWGALVLALSLRGHEGSRDRSGETVHYRELPESDWLAALADIRAAGDALRRQGAHPDNLAVVGEGLGANLALHYALADPTIQAVVMLSPGLDYQGVRTEGDIARLTDCPSLLIAGEGDAYGAMSAAALKAAAPVYAELRTWSGGTHGADLFVAHPEAIHYVLDWLRPIIATGT